MAPDGNVTAVAGRRAKHAGNLSRRTFTLIGFAAILGLAACQTDDTPCHMGLATSLPFAIDAGGHADIDAAINDHPAKLIFDTGAQLTVLSVRSLKKLGLLKRGLTQYTIEGIGGSRPLGVAERTKLQLGRLVGNHFPLNFSGIDIAPADGLLGQDFLYNYDIDLDWSEHKILLYQPLAGCKNPSVALGEPLYTAPLFHTSRSPSTRFFVEIRGITLTAELDTGAPTNVMFRSGANRLGLVKGAIASDPHGTTEGVGPDSVASVSHFVEPVTIGDLIIEHMRFNIVDQLMPGADMLIGVPFISRVHLWISNSSHTLVMQFPPTPSPHF